ncbi:hypothetical protein ACWEHA_01795 [Amycolatopsis nivea]
MPGSEIVIGTVGRFWQPDIRWYGVSTMRPEDFAAFAEPGWARIAAGFSVRPCGQARTLVSYEAHCHRGLRVRAQVRALLAVRAAVRPDDHAGGLEDDS